jgi:hypothetical protein
MKSADMPSTPPPAAGATKDVFVNRLARLIQLHRNFQDDLNPLGLRLLERSIRATYRDCIDFGAADQAHTLLVRSGIDLK